MTSHRCSSYFAIAVSQLVCAVIVITAINLTMFAIASEPEVSDENSTSASDSPTIIRERYLTSQGLGIEEAEVDPLQPSLCFAEGPGTARYLIISNPCPWTEIVDCTWRSEPPSILRQISGPLPTTFGSNSSDTKGSSLRSQWQVSIPAASRVVWQIPSKEYALSAWSYRLDPQVRLSIESKLNQLSQSLSHLTAQIPIEGVPDGGDFEVSGLSANDDASLPKHWGFSLSPSTKWRWTASKSRAGSGSARYESLREADRGWIQTPPLTIPPSGNLTASVWLLIDDLTNVPTVTTTTAHIASNGERMEWRHTQRVKEKSDASGWQRFDFPIFVTSNCEPPATSESRVRFTLDIEGVASLFVDDFVAGQIFLGEEERRKLRTELYVARRELSQNSPKSAWDLVNSEAFRFVVDTAPKVAPTTVDSTLPINASKLSPNEPRRALLDLPKKRVR